MKLPTWPMSSEPKSVELPKPMTRAEYETRRALYTQEVFDGSAEQRLEAHALGCEGERRKRWHETYNASLTGQRIIDCPQLDLTVARRIAAADADALHGPID